MKGWEFGFCIIVLAALGLVLAVSGALRIQEAAAAEQVTEAQRLGREIAAARANADAEIGKLADRQSVTFVVTEEGRPGNVTEIHPVTVEEFTTWATFDSQKDAIQYGMIEALGARIDAALAVSPCDCATEYEVFQARVEVLDVAVDLILLRQWMIGIILDRAALELEDLRANVNAVAETLGQRPHVVVSGNSIAIGSEWLWGVSWKSEEDALRWEAAHPGIDAHGSFTEGEMEMYFGGVGREK